MGLERGSKVRELLLRQGFVWIPEVSRANGPATMEEGLFHVDDYD